jgi:hypothetical protein
VPGELGVDVGIAGRPVGDGDVSGDAAAVVHLADRSVLAVIDGLGHGPEAAAAAAIAQDTILGHADESLTGLVERCHRAMTASRGAAIAFAVIEAVGTMEWLSIGNVEAALVRGGRVEHGTVGTVFHAPGVVGSILPALRPRRTTVAPGDVLVMATDGVDLGFLDDPGPIGPVQRAADELLATRRRGGDDALVLVARLTRPVTATSRDGTRDRR